MFFPELKQTKKNKKSFFFLAQKREGSKKEPQKTATKTLFSLRSRLEKSQMQKKKKPRYDLSHPVHHPLSLQLQIRGKNFGFDLGILRDQVKR